MPLDPSPRLARIVASLAGVLVLKVVVGVVGSYPSYIPPDFTTDFLRGREGHFFGWYQAAFHVHILSGPVSLALGLVLVSERVRSRAARAHRILGRVQAGCVLLLVVPSGLGMAAHAAAGPVAGAALAVLAVGTGASTALGVRAAIQRRLDRHRRWMGRSYALLCSAVVLRVMGGMAAVAGVTADGLFDPLAAWLSWLLPLAAFEAWERAKARRAGYRPGGWGPSPPAIETSARREPAPVAAGMKRTLASAIEAIIPLR